MERGEGHKQSEREGCQALKKTERKKKWVKET